MVRRHRELLPCDHRARKVAFTKLMAEAEVEPAAKAAKVRLVTISLGFWVRFTSRRCSNFAKLQVTTPGGTPTASVTRCDATIFPGTRMRYAATEVRPVATAAAVGAEIQLSSNEDGRLGSAGGNNAHCDSLRGRVALF
jgi:hypothetical protein